jgi:fructose-bisphosphate aldolase class 1
MAAGGSRGFGFRRGGRSNADEIDELNKTINEQSDEQRKLAARFSKAMNDFATERSLETCLEALNVSIQLANVRGKISSSWEHYARMLEGEVTRLTRQAERAEKK